MFCITWVQVSAVPTEWPSPQGLLSSGNAAFNKLGSLLTYLTMELESLQRQVQPLCSFRTCTATPVSHRRLTTLIVALRAGRMLAPL